MINETVRGLFPIPLVDQVECVRREIKMREHIYPVWVANGTLHQSVANIQLAEMKAVLATLLIIKHVP